MIQSIEFIETVDCKVSKAYNRYSTDTHSDPFGKKDIDKKINIFFKANPDIKIISAQYMDGTSHIHGMPVKISKMLLIYEQPTKPSLTKNR